MPNQTNFFSRKEQAEFIQRVYKEAPPAIQNYFNSETELLRNALIGCSRVLEVGCGFGRALSGVDSAIEYTGVDIGFDYVAEAQILNPQFSWVCGDATVLPFKSEIFDAVFLIQNTLGNMEGIEAKVLAASRRVASKNGRLVVSVYSEDSFEIRRTWYDRLVDAGIFGHVWLDGKNPKIARSDTGWSSRCFDRQELTEMLKAERTSIEITKLDHFIYFCVLSV
jgi:SAM-dependent methyltransferase